VTEPVRRLLADAAARGASYLENLPARSVYPRAADVERLREARSGSLPDVSTPDAEVLEFLDR
jgi:hypothetical protein